MPASINEGFDVLSREAIDQRFVHAGRPWLNTNIVAVPGNNNAHLAYAGLIAVDTTDDTIWYLTDISQVAVAGGWTEIDPTGGGMTITVDTIITDGGTNPVQSNAIFDALADKLDRPAGNPTEDSVVQVASDGSVSFITTPTGGGGTTTTNPTGATTTLSEDITTSSSVFYVSFMGGITNTHTLVLDVIDDIDNSNDTDVLRNIFLAFGDTAPGLPAAGAAVPSDYTRSFTLLRDYRVTYPAGFNPVVVYPLGTTLNFTRTATSATGVLTITAPAGQALFRTPSGGIFGLTSDTGGQIKITTEEVDTVSGHIELVAGRDISIDVNTTEDSITFASTAPTVVNSPEIEQTTAGNEQRLSYADNSITRTHIADNVLPIGIALTNTAQTVTVGAVAYVDEFIAYLNISTTNQTGIVLTTDFSDATVWEPVNTTYSLTDISNIPEGVISNQATRGQVLTAAGDGSFSLQPITQSAVGGVHGLAEIHFLGSIPANRGDQFPVTTVGNNVTFAPWTIGGQNVFVGSDVNVNDPAFLSISVSTTQFAIGGNEDESLADILADLTIGTNVLRLQDANGNIIFQGRLVRANVSGPTSNPTVLLLLEVLPGDTFAFFTGRQGTSTYNAQGIMPSPGGGVYTRTGPQLTGAAHDLQIYIRNFVTKVPAPVQLELTYSRTGQADVVSTVNFINIADVTVAAPRAVESLVNLNPDGTSKFAGTGFTSTVNGTGILEVETLAFEEHPSDFVSARIVDPNNFFPELDLAIDQTNIIRIGSDPISVESADGSVVITRNTSPQMVGGITVNALDSYDLRVNPVPGNFPASAKVSLFLGTRGAVDVTDDFNGVTYSATPYTTGQTAFYFWNDLRRDTVNNTFLITGDNLGMWSTGQDLQDANNNYLNLIG